MQEKSEKSKKSIVKSGLLLTLMTFASRIMGLVREITKASFLGTGIYADSFSVFLPKMQFLPPSFRPSKIILQKVIQKKTRKQPENFLQQPLH